MGKFRFLTGGESHGRGLIAIVEGMVADLPLEKRYINRQLKRRQARSVSLLSIEIGKTGSNS